jgi:hypothetical protein
MLHVNQLIGFGAGGKSSGPLTAVNTALTGSATDTNAYSFASTAIGTAFSDRYVVVAVYTTTAVSSVTVAGQACSLIRDSNSFSFYITDSPVTSNTTATIAVNTSTNSSRCVIGVWSVRGAVKPVLAGSYGASSTSPSATFNSDAGDVILGIARNFGGTSLTWTGLTERGNVTYETFYVEYADRSSAVAESVSFSGSASPNGTWHLIQLTSG